MTQVVNIDGINKYKLFIKVIYLAIFGVIAYMSVVVLLNLHTVALSQLRELTQAVALMALLTAFLGMFSVYESK